MAGKLVNGGENRIANILYKATAVEATLYLGLYTDPTTEPAETAVLADLTEPTGNGYARIALTRGSWTITADLAEYAQQIFTASGGTWGNVYGYFITDIESGISGGILEFVEQFSEAPLNVGNGSSIKVTPKITVA